MVTPNDTIHLFYGASIRETAVRPTGPWPMPGPPGGGDSLAPAFLARRSFAAFDPTGDGWMVMAAGGNPK